MSPTKTGSKIQLSFEQMELHTKHPFGISYGTSSQHISVLVRLRHGDFEGLGEACPVTYHGETISTVEALLKEWKDADILGDDPFALAEITKRLDKHVAGNTAAKSAVEMALHDLLGKVVGQPTYRLLGLQGSPCPITDFTIGIDSLDVVEKKTAEAVEAGYKALKVKQGTSYDREIIKRVRKVAKDLPLRVDANGGWTVKQAIEMSKFLAEHGVQFIEQPLPKFALKQDFQFVKEHSPLPIFADESIGRANDVARLAGAIDGVVVKLAKTGGITEALKVIHVARAHGLQIMFGCMVESSLGVTAAAQLQSLCDYLDLDGAMLLADDPFDGAVYDDGHLILSDRPGLGVVPRGGSKQKSRH
jgi:L-alanine-DL-glutamate epimerase-like enolase superfamily enzyme